jgi:TetR/AcrR family tetracycline transcriptional repressor
VCNSAGVLVHFVLGRAVEDQTRRPPGEEVEAIAAASFPFPLMARGLRERGGSTVEDDFRYALGVLLAGLEAVSPNRDG